MGEWAGWDKDDLCSLGRVIYVKEVRDQPGVRGRLIPGVDKKR